MHSVSLVGSTLTAVGIAGYVVGVATPYPGRAFSLTALMVGLTALAVRRSERSEGSP